MLKRSRISQLVFAVLVVSTLSSCSLKSNEEKANEGYVRAANVAREMESETSSHEKKYDLYKLALNDIDDILGELQSTEIAVSLTSGKLKIADRTLNEFLSLDAELSELVEFQRLPFSKWIKFLIQRAPNDRLAGSMITIVESQVGSGDERKAKLIYDLVDEVSESIEDRSEKDKFIIETSVIYATSFSSQNALKKVESAAKVSGALDRRNHKEEYVKYTPAIAEGYYKNGKMEIASTLLQGYLERVRTNQADPEKIASELLKVAKAHGVYNASEARRLAVESLDLYLDLVPGYTSHTHVIELLELFSKIDEKEATLLKVAAGLEWAIEGMPSSEISTVSIYSDYAKLYSHLGFTDRGKELVSLAESDPEIRIRDYTTIAESYVELGDEYKANHWYSKALTQTVKMENEYWKNSGLHSIGSSQALHGFIDEASKTAEKITDKHGKEIVLFNISRGYAKQGRYLSSLKSANDLTNGRFRMIAWRGAIDSAMKSHSGLNFEGTLLAYRQCVSMIDEVVAGLQ